MKVKNKKNNFNKSKLIKIVIILIVIILFGIGFHVGKRIKDNFNATLVNSQITIEDKLLEKDKTIEELKNIIQDLQQKQEELINKQTELEEKNKELETQIEKIRVSKLKTNQSATTSRSSIISHATEKTQIANTNWVWANVSAYCPCAQCCGKVTGITASGTKATAGRTIAASNAYAFGTKIEIQGYGTYTVEDRGGAITGNKIDMYFNSHSEALAFGRKQLQIRVVQ